jgi:hypothetical protein
MGTYPACIGSPFSQENSRNRRASLTVHELRLGVYHITSAFRTCLNAAADHLHAVTRLVVEHRQLNLAATGSLARGATAFWVIHPKSRDERSCTRCSGGRRTLMTNRERWAISALEAPSRAGVRATSISRIRSPRCYQGGHAWIRQYRRGGVRRKVWHHNGRRRRITCY